MDLPHGVADLELARIGWPTSLDGMRQVILVLLAVAITTVPAFGGIKKEGRATKKERVTALLRDAAGFIGTGRYDLARKRCNQALSVDPFNTTARALLEKIGDAERREGFVPGRTEYSQL